ncbi:MAG: helix-turn-helix domain-containing protein [Rhodospirillales bacterium]
MEEALSRPPERCDDAGGCVRQWSVGGARMSEIAYAGKEPHTGDADAEPDERMFLAVLQLAGSAIVAHGRLEVLLQTGDVALVDGGRARWSSAGEHGRQLCLHLPQAWLRGRLPSGALPQVRVLAGHVGLGALLAGLLNGLRNGGEDLDAGLQAAVHDAVVGLVIAVLTRLHPGARAGATHRPLSSAAMLRWPALCAFIETRLREPSLSPDDVARGNGISTRHLHRLFHQAGTSFGTFVRDLRLARCRADLADPRCADLSVTAIAFQWGFSDSAHFSRSFKATYGITARAFRHRRFY